MNRTRKRTKPEPAVEPRLWHGARCAHCGEGDGWLSDALLPIGPRGKVADVHWRCYPAWLAERRRGDDDD